ncbi:MAG: TRAP transporter small permease subunit [Boseongicola sp. SB0676_bin_33]|nr:TRAP transporter small permease subunit [Boseongicola sp. SB0676_bin_33]
MSTVSDPDILSRRGTPALVTRVFGWAMLAALAAFMINNVFIVGWGFPKPTLAFGGDGRAWLLVAIYVLLVVLAILWVLRTPDRALRYDARAISDFNAYLIRGCYFAVLFTGIADATIAFIRVEGLLPYVFGEKLSHDLLRSHFIGPWIHFPLAVLGFVVAAFSRSLGFIWLALLIVMAELLIVFSRFVFSYEQALMGDLVRYWYAALFLFSSAYTLLEEGHVRVDVLYAGFDVRRKGRVNAVGSILLGMSTCWVIILVGMGSANAIVNSPVRNFEVSQTGTAGMYTKYQMAAFLGIFAITMLIQFVSYLFEAVADMRDEPGHRDVEPVGH